MTYIKKLVMHGFKSFAQKTEIIFKDGINIIVGPNGSGKSNISNALCFVLGRLSMKSMRAAKASNLMFMGSKFIKPAHEAYVEMVFDNTDKTFALPNDEIIIRRMVRKNGQSIYKINGETKTRMEMLEVLAQAGIDPNGYNVILQGQIQAIVKMHPEERRKIIEEVAGISVYESRKQKSLHELEKTEERLKEVSTILRERTTYLKNLDKEREQALKFKELEGTIGKLKASILSRKIEDKEKEIATFIKGIEAESKKKDVKRDASDKLNVEIETLGNRINEINRQIQRATGLEQETLHTSISNLRAELEGLRVRKENYENRRVDFEKRMKGFSDSIPAMEEEIKDLRRESPLLAKKAQELKIKKEELATIEDERKKSISLKAELNATRNMSKEKEKLLSRVVGESESLIRQIENNSRENVHKNADECEKTLHAVKHALVEARKTLESLRIQEIENAKAISGAENEIEKADKIKNSVTKIDICPLCQSKITSEHVNHVLEDCDSKIAKSEEIKETRSRELHELSERRTKLNSEVVRLEESLGAIDAELVRQRIVKEKHEEIKKTTEEEKALKEEIRVLEEKRRNLESKGDDLSLIEERYHSKMLEIEEVSSRSEEDTDTTLLYKEREVEKARNIIKQGKKDLDEIQQNIDDMSSAWEGKNEELAEKDAQEKELSERFKKLFEERDTTQKTIQGKNMEIMDLQRESGQIEEQVNYLRIGKARLDAEKENFQLEIAQYAGVEIMKASINALEERLQKANDTIRTIGSINMKALEEYDAVKKEYDLIEQKVNTLIKEKEEIMKIIEEIDKKKARTFMKTFNEMNDRFTGNFAQLYTKGTAFLEIENKEDIFAGGVNIVVRLAKGKYFDISSLSGGEQTLVAVSLLFAIQEYKPYKFYILDEIDAALDKRNSERLAALLTKYMKSGQYIVITHNDAIMMNPNVDIMYGVSMHDGVSKILSLKLT
ncbi:MAG: chromosome segregation SMC family protein [archaeon]